MFSELCVCCHSWEGSAKRFQNPGLVNQCLATPWVQLNWTGPIANSSTVLGYLFDALLSDWCFVTVPCPLGLSNVLPVTAKEQADRNNSEVSKRGWREGVGYHQKTKKIRQKVLQKCVPLLLRGHRKRVQNRGRNL